MKILGLSCGRKNGNSDTMLKEALMQAQKVSGAEVEYIRLQELTIKTCTGCESCMKNMLTGGDARCVIKNDHFAWLVEKMGESKGLILATPAYHVMPPGLLITIMNRSLGVGTEYRANCARNPKIGAVITLGGTDWTNLVLPIAKTSLVHLGSGLKIVDQMLVKFVTSPGQVVLRDDAMARVAELGRRVGEALKMPIGDVRYLGKEEETCSLCHTNLLQIRGKKVVCPICEIEGDIALQGDGYKVTFSKEEQKKQRFGEWGMQLHNENVMKGHKAFMERKDEIKERLEKYKGFKGYVKPPSIAKK